MALSKRKYALVQACLNRRFLAMNAIIVASIVLVLFFPISGAAERFVLAFSTYFLLPAVFVRLVLREPLSTFGFSWGRRGVFLNVVLIVLSVCVFGLFVWGVLAGTSFGQAFLNVSRGAHAALHSDFWVFLGSLGFLAWFVFLKEVFFRGFFLLFWKRYAYRWSLVVHFLLIAAVSTKELQIFADSGSGVTFLFTIVWSVIASILAFVTESVFVSFFFSLFSAILISVLAISIS